MKPASGANESRGEKARLYPKVAGACLHAQQSLDGLYAPIFTVGELELLAKYTCDAEKPRAATEGVRDPLPASEDTAMVPVSELKRLIETFEVVAFDLLNQGRTEACEYVTAICENLSSLIDSQGGG